MTTPNVALLRKTLAHIEANPTLWHQARWVVETPFGTAHDFTGWAAVLSGAKFVNDLPDCHEVIPPGQDEPTNLPDYVATLLGVEPFDEGAEGYDGHLFDASNGLDDLRRRVDELCAKAGE